MIILVHKQKRYGKRSLGMGGGGGQSDDGTNPLLPLDPQAHL